MSQQRLSLKKEMKKSQRQFRSFLSNYLLYTLEYLKFLSAQQLTKDEQLIAERNLIQSMRLLGDYHLLLHTGQELYHSLDDCDDWPTPFVSQKNALLSKLLLSEIQQASFIENKAELQRVLKWMRSLYLKHRDIEVIIERPACAPWLPNRC